jgi:hypothetical protein
MPSWHDVMAIDVMQNYMTTEEWIDTPECCCYSFQLFCLQRVVFELEAIDQSAKPKLPHPKKEHKKQTELFLRGQMKFIERWNAMAFLCNPL